MRAHLWLAGFPKAAEEQADISVDCHRRLRGPYTGTAAVLRALVPEIMARNPELARGHVIEILAMAPDLQALTGPAPDTLTTLAQGMERTRIYAAGRTRQLAHGIVDLITAYAEDRGECMLTLAFRNVDEADHTDQEFLAILLRRAGQRIRVIAGTRTDRLPADLLAALRAYTRRVSQPPPVVSSDARDPAELLQAYIDSDGTSDDPAEIAAYRQADPTHRAALHDARAERLRREGEWGTQLGAIPYHLEHGADPGDAGGAALLEAARYAIMMGYYHAVAEDGARGRAVTDPENQLERWWDLTGGTANALSLLGRAEEAEQLYMEVRRRVQLPLAQMASSYALAMVYTRYHEADRKDDGIAEAYLSTAIAIASLWPERTERAFYTVFFKNGLALVVMHMGDLAQALRLVTEGRELLDRELAPGAHQLHRSVLVANRASVLARIGRLEQSLADFNAAIAVDPNYPDYYFERADVRRRMGDLAGALADYGTAETLAPPYWELHYNRASVAAEAGDLAAAIADLSRVMELEPAELDARVNLASLLADAGEPARARAVINEGLLLHPGDPTLLCVRAQIAAERGEADGALADLGMSLSADPGHIGALAARAAIAYEATDYEAAISDLTRAVEIAGDDPDLFYNRGLAFQAAGLLDAAADDFTQALQLDGADTEELHRQLRICLHGGEGPQAPSPYPRTDVPAEMASTP